jgi:hypothetical protein
MKAQKLYFKSIDDTFCSSLESHLQDARLDGFETVTLIEAIPDKENPDYIFCGLMGEVGKRQECKKSQCDGYSSKSGRGVCKHRGSLYQHGEEVTFDMANGEALKNTDN